MNLFDERNLEIENIDYIRHQRPNGRLMRLYRTRCSQCRIIIFKDPKNLRMYKDHYCNDNCRNIAHSLRQMGSKNPNWKGGCTPEIIMLRTTSEYIEWRTLVYQRDDYTCQDCGQRGGDLEAHHLIMVSENPGLIFDTDNGRTLCILCHKIIRGYEIEYRRAV